MLFAGHDKSHVIKVWGRRVKNKRRGNYSSIKREGLGRNGVDHGSVRIPYLLCLLLLAIHGWEDRNDRKALPRPVLVSSSP